ncbi:hypothetical protein [Wenyingzhuangia sp. IMCC45574]
MRKFLLVAVLLLVGVTTYGQNYNYPVGLYSYGTLSTLNNNVVDSISVVDQTKQIRRINGQVVQRNQNYSYPVGLYSYSSLRNSDSEFVKKAKTKKQIYAEALKSRNEKSRKNIVIRKAKTEVLVRYNGKYSSIKLINLKGQEVKADFSKKYKGLIVPRSKAEQKYFLEVVKNKANTYYHQVTL